MKGKRKKGKINKSPLPSQNKWFSNVAKSFGFASADIIRDIMPSIYEFGEDNASTYGEIINQMRDNAMDERMIDRTMSQVSPLMKLTTRGLQNALEDIKSGNFYNKQRDLELTMKFDQIAEDEMFDFGDEEFDFGSDFDVPTDDDIFIEEDGSDTIIKPVKVFNKNVNQVPNMMPVAKVIADHETNTSVATIETIHGFARQEKTFEVQRLLRETEFNNALFGNLAAINENLSHIISIKSDNESKYIASAITFFGDQIEISREILNAQKGDDRTPEEIKDDDRAKNTRYKEDIFLSEGGLDIRAYFKNVIDNIRHMEEFEDYFDMGSLIMDSDDEDLERMITQPLKFIPKMFIKSFIPKAAQNSLNLIDESFKSFTGSFVAKLNAMADSEEDDSLLGTVKNFIGRALGYKQDAQNYAELGNYERGEVPFDGVTRRTIVDVIPTYLRRIESAITNTNERVYDYDAGKFIDIQEMIKQTTEAERRAEVGGQTDVMTYFNRALSQLRLEKDEESSFREDLYEYFKAMNDSSKMINPFVRYNMAGDEIDDLDDNLLFMDPSNRELFRVLARNMDKNMLMKMTGENIFKSVKSRNEFYDRITADPTLYGYKYSHDNAYIADDYEENESGSIVRKNTFEMLDEYGQNNLGYLRDIRSILLSGVRVFMDRDTESSGTPIDLYSDIRERIQAEEETRRTNISSRNEAIENLYNNGRRSIYDVIDMDSQEIRDIVNYQNDSQEIERDYLNALSETRPHRGVFGKLRHDIRQGVVKLTDKPSKAINDFLYKLIFGDEEDNSEDIDSYIDYTRTKLSAFHSWAINNVYDPVKESLIGPEGLITKLKDSKFFKTITDKKNEWINKLLGEKDELGKRSGGLLSTFRNKTVDFFKSIGHYFTGNEYITTDGRTIDEDENAVFRQIKSKVKETFGRGKDFLLGTDEEEGILKKTYTKFMDGLDIFKESMFGKSSLAGYDSDKRKTMTEFAEDIKSRLPKALGRGLLIGAGKTILFSKAGLLGSIFLPGGPIGAVLAGTAASLLMESDKFKDWLFGEKDPDDPDKRLGGFIPKNLQDLFNENKTPIKIGGLIGAGFGLLPSFFLPGGPLTGALLGIASGLVTKSDAFQEFLYGENFKDGDKKLMNGAIGKAYSKAKGWLDAQGVDFKLATFLGGTGTVAGAFGLLPSFFLPGGPIGGALFGLAGGIAASTDKFQKWFFGEKGWDGKRSGGLIDKFKTWFDIEIVDSIKITMKEWNMKISDFLYDNIAEPFLSALDPMKRIVTDTIDGVKNLFKRGWDKINDSIINTFKDNVIKPFGESLNKFIVNPLKKFLNKSFSILGKVVGGVISAPFKLLGFLGKRADKNAKTDDEKEARRQYHEAADKRAEKRAERRAKVQEEIDELKQGQTRDREYFRRDGRFRNADAKEKWETEQKEKQLWYQQHTSETITEANEKLENIDKAILNIEGTGPKILSAIEDKLLSELRELRRTIAEDLEKFKQKGYGDTSNLRNKDFSHLDAEDKKKEHDFKIDQIRNGIRNMNRPDSKNQINDYLKNNYPEAKLNMDAATEEAKKYQDPNINKIVDLLRRKGQSHAEGLDRVPYDGYVAELHEGERIVPPGESVGMMDPEMETKKITFLGSISKYTKTAADAVYGQLNGVGHNIHHIRKMLQHITGLKNDEIDNIQDQNLPEGGLLSRLFGGARSKLGRPVAWIKDIITTPFRIITNTISGVVKGIKNIGSKILSGVGKVVDAFIEIPGKVISTTMDVTSTVIKGSANILFKGLNLALKGTATVISDVYKGSRFIVSSISKSFVPALVGAGKLVGNVLHGIGTAGKFAIETVIGLGKGLYTLTRDVIGFGYTLTKDVLKGITGVTKGILKTTVNLAKGVASGIGAVFSGGAGLVGRAFGVASFKDGLRKKVQDVRLVGGSLDKVVEIEKISTMDTVKTIGKVDVLDAIQEIRKLESVDKLNTIVDGIKIINSGGTTRVQPQTVEERIITNINNMNINDEIQKDTARDNVTAQESTPKQQYEDQIKAQRQAHEDQQKADERRAEAKADFEYASRLSSDYVQEQKRIKKERKLDTDYKTETMKDIDSTEKILNKQYKFWDDIFGKNGKLETKLNSLWEWLKKLGPLALSWLSGTGLGKALSSIFGGTGFATAIKSLLTTLTPTFAGLLLDEIDKKSRNERAEQYNLSDREAYLGVGDEDRYAGEEKGYILNGSRLEARRHVIKNGVRDVLQKGHINEIVTATGKVVDNAKPYVTSAIDKGKSTLSSIYNNTIGRMGKRATTETVQTGLTVTQTADILDDAGNIIGEGRYTIIDTADEVTKKNKKLFGKFVDLVSEKLKQIVQFVASKLGDSKILTKIDDVVKPLVTKLKSGASKIIKKYAPKISEFFVSTGAGTATAFILDAGFAIWDATTGFTKSEAANLFGVKPEDVDFRMRTISSALKTVTKFSWIGVIYLANEILADVFDLNLLRSLAGLIYSLVADRDDEAKLKDDQASMEAEWKQYNEEHGTNMSKEAYIDMQSPTVFEKITNNKWTKNFKGAFDKGSAARALGKDTSELTFGDRVKYFFGHNINNIQNLFRSKDNKKTDSEYFGTTTKSVGMTGDAGKGEGVKSGGILSGIVGLASSLFNKITGRSSAVTQTAGMEGHAGMGEGTTIDYQNINDNANISTQQDQMTSLNSNIFHIRKMMQYMTGLKNTDVEKITDTKVKGGLLSSLFGITGKGLNTVSTAAKASAGAVPAAAASLLGTQRIINNITQTQSSTITEEDIADMTIDTTSTSTSTSTTTPKKTTTTGNKSLLSKAVDKVKSGINWVKKLFGYAQGTPWIPDTQVALIHEGEMIVPAEHNPLNPENQATYAPLLTSLLEEKGKTDTDQTAPLVEPAVIDPSGLQPYIKEKDKETTKVDDYVLNLLEKDVQSAMKASTMTVQLASGSSMVVNGIENVADSIVDTFKKYLDTKVTIPESSTPSGETPQIADDGEKEVETPKDETPTLEDYKDKEETTEKKKEEETKSPTLDDYKDESISTTTSDSTTSSPTLSSYTDNSSSSYSDTSTSSDSYSGGSSYSDYSTYTDTSYSDTSTSSDSYSDDSGYSYYSKELETVSPVNNILTDKQRLKISEQKISKLHEDLKETKYTNFYDAVNWLSGAWNTGKTAVSNVANAFVDNHKKSNKEIKEGVGVLKKAIDKPIGVGKLALSNVFEAVKGNIKEGNKNLKDNLVYLRDTAYNKYISEDDEVGAFMTALGLGGKAKPNVASRALYQLTKPVTRGFNFITGNDLSSAEGASLLGEALNTTYNKAKTAAQINIIEPAKEKLNQVKEFGINTWDTMKQAGTNVFDAVKDNVKQGNEELKESFGIIKDEVSKPLNTIKTAGTNVAKAIVEEFKKGNEDIKKNFGILKDEVSKPLNVIKNVGSNVAKAIKEEVQKGNEDIKKNFGILKDEVSKPLNIIKTAGSNVAKAVKEEFKKGNENISKSFSVLKDSASKPLNTIKTAGSNVAKALYDNFKKDNENISKSFSTLKDGAITTLDTIKQAGKNVGSAMVEQFQKDNDTIKSSFNTLKETISNFNPFKKNTGNSSISKAGKESYSKAKTTRSQQGAKTTAKRTTTAPKSTTGRSYYTPKKTTTTSSKNKNNTRGNAQYTTRSGSSTKKSSGGVLSKVGNWLKSKLGLGKGGDDTTISLAQQLKPRNYVFSEEDNKYDGVDLGKRDGGLHDKGNTHNFPYFSQQDDRWGKAKLIGAATIQKSGCGPTSAAMVLTHLTGQYITPDTMAKAGEGTLPGYASDNYFPTVASKFKLNYSEIQPDELAMLKSTLRSGKPVIISGFDSSNSGNSPFTSEGHIVVATGVAGERIEINDPRGPAYSGSYSISDIVNNMKKGIILTSTKETANVGLPSSGTYDDSIKFTGDYTMSGDLPLEEGLNEILGGAVAQGGGSGTQQSDSSGQIKLWEKVLGYARAFKGKLTYSYGSDAINRNGKTTDCSAFTQHVLKRAAGIDVGRSSSAQYSAGSKTSTPQAGDLVVWSGHAGLVADSNGNMIDAGSGSVPKERSYESGYWRGRNGRVFRRVLPDPNKLVSPKIDNYHTGIGFNGIVGSQGGQSLSGAGDTSGGTTTGDGATSGSSAPAVPELGVFDSLSNGISNIVASMYSGKQVDLFGGSSSTTTGDSTSTTTQATGKGNFPKYTLTDAQIKGLAHVVEGEQPGKAGHYAEASIMANLTDISGDDKATTENLIKKVTGGWFANGKSRFNNPGNPSSSAIEAVKEVLVNGKRTLPRYVNEHDCFADITSATNDGSPINKTSRDQYKQFVTKIKNRYGASGTFYTFPSNNSDPFYYTSESYRKKWGEDHYSIGDAGKGEEEFVDDSIIAELDVMDFDDFTSDMGPAIATSAQAAPSGGIPDSMNGWSYYQQTDPRWQEDISGRKVGPAGCGMASHAMMLTSLFGKQITPVTVGKYARSRGLWPSGMSWAMPSRVAKDFGLTFKPVVEKSGGAGYSDLQALKAEIKTGKPAVLSGQGRSNDLNTPFTSGGHIVLAVGVEGSTGNLIINDPRGVKYTKAYSDKGVMDIGTGLRGAWSFATNSNSKIPSFIESGGDFSGGGSYTATEGGDASGGSASSIPELGAFDLLSNAMSNIVASMYNGKQVDLFATQTSSDSSTTSDGSNPDISSITDTTKAVWTFFTGKGYSKEATAGILGNMKAESGINPKSIQGNGKGPAAGICQWENYNKKSLRWKEMADYAASKGKDWTDLQSQLEFVDMELAGTSKDKYTNQLLKKRVGGLDKFKALTSVDTATVEFESAFERAGVKAYPKRKGYANSIYKAMTSAGTGPDIFNEMTLEQPSMEEPELTTNVTQDGWTYYSQTDPKWNTTNYSGNTLRESGCGPTSLAMIATKLTGKKITPDIVASAAYEAGVWSDSSSWDIFPWFAKELGLEYTVAHENDMNALSNMINSGQSVVASGILGNINLDQENKFNPNIKAPFTESGHIVPIIGINNKKFMINDPRGESYKGLYTADQISSDMSTLRGAWGYKATGNILEKLEKSSLNPDRHNIAEQNEPIQEVKQYDKSELYKNAGLGEGKTSSTNIIHTYKPEIEKVTKPIEDINTNILNNLNASTGHIEGMETINSNSDLVYVKAALESLNVAVQELKSINENTKQTAESVSKIKVYSENESVGSVTSENNNDKINKMKAQTPDNSSSKVKALDSNEYKIARLIASFKK